MESVDLDSTPDNSTLYFFPDAEITEAQLNQILEGSDEVRQAWAVSHMLRYAIWEDIWHYVDREKVISLWPLLDLSDNLRKAWGRMLGVASPAKA